MNRLPRLLTLLLACCTVIAHAQTRAFNDTFTGASTVNANPSSPADSTSTAASYQQLAAKSFSPNPPSVSSGNLRFGIVSTSSGFNEIQALFTKYPVTLVNVGDYIELKVVFSTEGGIITSQTASGLFFGLFNGSQVQPIPGGMNGTEATATAGYAQGWQGYVNKFFYTGGANFFSSRPAQAVATSNQDVLFAYSGASTIGSTSTSTLAAFTVNATYTEVFRITKASATALTLSASLYSGAVAAGSPLYTQTVNSTSTLTAVYDAFAIGWRATGSVVSIMNLKSVTISTTGTTTIIPEITAQPLSLTKSIGDSTTFTVTADGGVGTALTYQWRKDGVDLPGATSAAYTIASTAASDAGDYTVVVSDVAGATTSAVATLIVTADDVAPSILIQPVGSTVIAGDPYTFTATVNGTAPIAYQWQRSTDGGANYLDISGATNASYTLAHAVLADAGLYRLLATNSVGTATSDAATLAVNQAPLITTQPVGGAIAVGGSITLTVAATGTPAPTYQWRKNGVNISGATSASYTIDSATGANTGNYTVVLANSVGSATSSVASVAVLSSTMTTTAVTPSASDTRNADTRLSITFNQAPIVGVSGYLRVYDASNNAVVDTIDLVAATALRDSLRTVNSLSTQLLPVQTKTIGGATGFAYYPITVTGNTATIYPRNGVLAYNKTYYVKVDAGVFVNSSGEAFAGISDSDTWRFSTKASAPATGETSITVAADGSGDFDTVQGALDFIPANNVTPMVIHVKNGTYFELVYFASKHFITLLGQDVDQAAIVYPNNAAFNSAPGVNHRGTFYANSVHDVTIANLTISNTTPQGGTQAEAIIVTGTSASTARNIISRCKFFSYQDTVQFNNQLYVGDSTIVGDVDFMWGSGPVYFANCDIRMLRSGAYFTQVRNGSGNHGFVFVGCRFTAPAGITGTFLGRIDPNSFPYNEVVVLDSTFGDATNNAFLATTTGVSGTNYLAGWWMLNNSTNTSATANVHNWSNHLFDANGATLADPNGDTFTNMPADATTQANYRDAFWVLNSNIVGALVGSWTPSLAPVVVTAPVSQTVNSGDSVTFTVAAFAIPTATYQWRKNGVDIVGATSSNYTIANVSGTDADLYSVVVSNSVGSVTVDAVPLIVHGGPPVLALSPADTKGLLGATATLNVWAVGDGPFAYQWLKDGAPIGGATHQSLRLTGLQPSDAGNYAVVVTNAGGTKTSASATLTTVAPAMTLPAVPQIPAGSFDVTAFGAVGDGATDNTLAIQAALNAANAAGGGTVELPPAAGAYLCGPITVYSHTNLQVDAGAMLRALPYGTYPNSFTAPAHFVNITPNATDIEFSGGGTIDGDGGAWWAAYAVTGPSTPRFRLVQISTVTRMLFTGTTFSNSATFHLAFRGPCVDVTIFGVTVYAPGNSPNTDGMDIGGTNFLVQNCSVSDGDDNIVAKPGGTFCKNIRIADCFIGTGHGISIGGQTNVGLDGMLVTNCTFDGTSSALRFKADPTQGGPVQNVTFSDLTMKNVLYPILFYSYYNQLGSPGAVSGTSQTTPAKVNAWNLNPPNSLASATIPTWKNITVKNLTVINGSGYSTIWGLPTADGLIANVTLENVTIQGGAGLELYNAANIQLVGTNSVGPVLTCNALAITGQPSDKTVNVGDSVTFSASAVGGSGTANSGLTYQWNLNGAPLTNGVQADGSTVSGATTATLAIANARVTGAGKYTLTVSTTLDGYNVATSSLVANSLPVSATSRDAVLIVNAIPATITLSDLTYTYDGNAKAPTATTAPAGLAVHFDYGAGISPINAGSYPVAATFVDPNYSGSASDTLVINPAPATVALGSLSQTYSGAPRTPSVTTTPSNLPVALTYAGDSTAPTNAGNYAVVATVTDPNYAGSDSQTFVISRATPNIVITSYSVIYDTQSHSAIGSAVGVLGEPLVGLDLSATQHTAAGNYTDAWFFTDVTGNYSNATGSVADTIAQAVVPITLNGLEQRYTGTPRVVTATTVPAGLAVGITYDGSAVAPIYPGSYAVAATISDANYVGSASDILEVNITALVRHLTSLNGGIDGSVQVLTAENSALNSAAWISGDLLVRGTPGVVLQGNPTYAGNLEGPGEVSPSNFTVTLNGCVLRHVVRRINPLSLPTVSAPPQPTGTRNVTINSASQSLGDFATLRNLTLNSKVGLFAIASGTYGDFTANKGAGFVLGVAGATQPAIYNLQSLTLNSGSRLEIAGPVILTLNKGSSIAKDVTTTAHPFDWFLLRIAAGGLSLNGAVELPAIVIAPNGTISLNGTSSIVGEIQADALTLASGAAVAEPVTLSGNGQMMDAHQ